ncbi:MFS transporter [Stakelama sp. CBK3Z-3]|uniref:MFS transporter n=1 Tax=Stakelama flava TaxID=2860338 RepID=A0ABS6XPM8_9SPHN|nr:MFS transporter [Stakelama flava]MBW4332126.1 MFS transporter [Stakelama flava]
MKQRSGEEVTDRERQVAEAISDNADHASPVKRTNTVSHHSPNYRTVALIIACGLFMQNLDATVLATALPTMAQGFGVSPAGISLALTSYLLALAIFIPASGVVADKFGPRQTFQSAIAVFLVGSVACALSPTLSMLVAARFLQGVGGAMMVPVGRLVLLRSVEKRDLVSAVSWLAMPAMIGPILGPPVGGFIVTYLHWSWIFWINVPMGLFGIFMVGRFVPNIRSEEASPFDVPGFLLSGAGLGAVLFGLELVSRPGHGQVAASLLLIGAMSLCGYVAHARRVERPILDLKLLRVKSFRLSVVGGTLLRITHGANPFLLPMLMQLAFGLSAAASGMVTVSTAVGAFAMKSVVRRLLRLWGFRNSLSAIGLMSPLTFAAIGLIRPSWPWPAIIALLMFYGFLTSLQFSALNTIVYDEVPQEQLSRATSFYSTVQQLSMSLGVVSGAGILTLSMNLNGHTEPQFGDFSMAMWGVATIGVLAIFANLRFDPDAGAEMAGRSRRDQP